MRIAVFHNLPAGGAKRALYEQARRLRERGHTLHGYTLTNRSAEYLPLEEVCDQVYRYDLHTPESTFYLFPRSPLEDDVAFCELLLEERILAMPGKMLESPGRFRLSLTASDEMIERALPGFERAMKRARA